MASGFCFNIFCTLFFSTAGSFHLERYNDEVQNKEKRNKWSKSDHFDDEKSFREVGLFP